MSTSAVTVTGLTKRYGRRTAVDELDIDLPTGVVAGFIGPNGAGKTTTMAMLLGLVRPTSGSGWVLGEPLDDPASYLPRVGALVESPAFYPALSGAENLALFARVGAKDPAAIGPVLATVGLSDRARRPLPHVLAGDEAAARHRCCADRRARAADPRRARERPRSTRCARHPRPRRQPRGHWSHSPRVVARSE